jgi:hypothetical protein
MNAHIFSVLHAVRAQIEVTTGSRKTNRCAYSQDRHILCSLIISTYRTHD